MKGKRWYGTDCKSTNEKNENKMTKMNTDVEFISTDFEEGEQLYNAFGGIAALLRYRTGV